ncbi:hypothetical protein ACFYMO_04070 [Streptomyces sp. NPDC007025]|uniref:hypothetical protein n=1 Tax=Streptomyces sp. NPDC007025 TaxID=3364771 RepID=UPI00368C6AA2
MTRAYVYGETPWDVAGPLATWKGTTKQFSPEHRALFREAMQTKTPPPCPVCGELVETMNAESVSVQMYMHEDFKEVGTLVTLEPCGHHMKR